VAPHLARLRLRNHHLSGGRFIRPEDVVCWLGAVQAQEYGDAKWALALRMRRGTNAAIDRTLDEGRILRTHVLRPTWHFVAPPDIRWMLALTGPCVSRRMAPYNRRLELDATVFRRSHKAIVRALSGHAHLTRQELKAVLQRAGIEADNAQRLAHIVMQAELEGLICSGPRKGKQFTYALLDERVPASSPLSRDAALAELARRYFNSHGPAQVVDFAWWSGLTMADARAGVAMVERDLVRETVAGKTHWLAASNRAHSAGRSAYLLPLYDEYLIAYKDRSGVLDRAFWTWASGDPFSAAVLVDGKVVGTWRRSAEQTRVVVTVTPCTSLRKRDMAAIGRAARAYADFVGLDLKLVWSASKSRAGAMHGLR
jgi:winged helix DNA-binding protein